jgi:hypothetical protein
MILVENEIKVEPCDGTITRLQQALPADFRASDFNRLSFDCDWRRN